MKKSTFSRLIGYVSKYKGYMFASLIFALISNVLIAFMPLIVGKAIDKIIAKGKVDFDGLVKDNYITWSNLCNKCIIYMAIYYSC